MSPGDSGADVAHLQGLLFGQGKTYVSVTGTYDEDTRRAVQEIQQERGLTEDAIGTYGRATRVTLDP